MMTKTEFEIDEILDIGEIEDLSYEAYHKYGEVKGEYHPATWDAYGGCPAEYPWVEGYEEYIGEIRDSVKKAFVDAGVDFCDDDVDAAIEYLEDDWDILTKERFEEKVFDDLAYENEMARRRW